MAHMDFGLAGTTAMVTGASQGIGREIARALHHEGVGLALIGRDTQRLEQAMAYIGEPASGALDADVTPTATMSDAAPIYLIEADLELQAEVEHTAQQAIARFGHVDFLVNNAGQVRTTGFFDMTDAEIEEAVQVKLLGYVRLVRALAPQMIERRSGAIVNIVGSTARTPTPDFIVGSMINAALVNFTRGLARELARSSVRVNAISPGWTLTERQRRSFEMAAAARRTSLQDVMQREARAIPSHHLVEMHEIATLTLLLLSGLVPSVVGEEFIIDGGATPST